MRTSVDAAGWKETEQTHPKASWRFVSNFVIFIRGPENFAPNENYYRVIFTSELLPVRPPAAAISKSSPPVNLGVRRVLFDLLLFLQRLMCFCPACGWRKIEAFCLLAETFSSGTINCLNVITSYFC